MTIVTRRVVTLYPSIGKGVTSKVTMVTTPMGCFFFTLCNGIIHLPSLPPFLPFL